MSVVIDRLDTAERDELFALLIDSDLPVDGLADHLATTLVARENGAIVGSAALELYEHGALLRSLAVAKSHRSRHVGRDMTLAALRLAEHLGKPAVYLLTQTAERYFPRFGFEPIARAEVPASVQQSIEFTAVCCASATVMRKWLIPSARRSRSEP